MTVFIASTTGITLDGDGSTNNGTINAGDVIDPITGNIGLKVVRIVNTSATNTATVTWTPQDTTYTFADVAYTTDSADGAGASFDVTVNFDGYTIAIADGGADFLVDDTILVLGENLGGTTTANNLTATVTAVGTGGAITELTVVGDVAWPQSTVGSIRVLPYGEDFVQVTNTAANGAYFTGNNVDGVMVITPVTIVG